MVKSSLSLLYVDWAIEVKVKASTYYSCPGEMLIVMSRIAAVGGGEEG